MKKGIHPDYHKVTVEMTDGSTFETRSTVEGEKIVLDIDVKTHPAWTGGQQKLIERGQLAKFNARYKNRKKATGNKTTNNATDNK